MRHLCPESQHSALLSQDVDDAKGFVGERLARRTAGEIVRYQKVIGMSVPRNEAMSFSCASSMGMSVLLEVEVLEMIMEN